MFSNLEDDVDVLENFQNIINDFDNKKELELILQLISCISSNFYYVKNISHELALIV